MSENFNLKKIYSDSSCEKKGHGKKLFKKLRKKIQGNTLTTLVPNLSVKKTDGSK